MVDEQTVTSNGVSTADKLISALHVAIESGIVTPDEVIGIVKPKQKGRKVTSLPEFTFPGSGITVRIRQLGPFTLDQINRQVREELNPPDVPKVMVNYGTPEKADMHLEENPADPAYKEALAEYERKIEESGARKTIDTIIKHAVVVDVDLDEVEAMREFLLDLEMPKEELDSISDHMIYVKHVCIKTTRDLQDLQKFVIGESVPTEERVQAHEDSFRS